MPIKEEIKIDIPSHIEGLKSYEPGKPVEKLKEEYGLDHMAVLWNSENCFGMSPKAKERIRNCLDDAYYYPDPLSQDARQVIAEHHGKQPENVVVGNGSEGVLFNILSAFCSGDDELLSADATFTIAYIWAKIHNINSVRVPVTPDHRFDLQAILDRISERTKVIYIANSNNPTGTMVNHKELKAFLGQVPQNILVIMDEAYYEYGNHLADDFPDSIRMGYSNVLTLRSFSKAYGLAGVRVGYAVGSEELIEYLLRVKLIFEPSRIVQEAAIGAIQDDEFLQKTLKNNQEGLEFYYKELEDLDIRFRPSYTNFVMMEMDSEDQATRIAGQLMKNGVLVRPLGAFGKPYCLRVAVGKPSDNEMFIEELRGVLKGF